MQALRPISAYSLQMDLSLSPKEEIKSEPEDDDDLRGTNAAVAVARHFEESLRRLSQFQMGSLPNGYYPQSRLNTFVPYMRFNNQEVKPPLHNAGSNFVNLPNSSSYHADFAGPSSSSFNALGMPTIQPPPVPYDVEYISQILKTFQFNRFLNSSILNQEIKEEPCDTPPESNGQGVFNQKRGPNDLAGAAFWNHKKIKRESPPLVTVNTDVDIEAELPCTSIKQRLPPKKKPTNPSKPAKPAKPAKPRKKTVKKDVVSPVEKPTKVLKQCSQRSTRRKTNYREASSDEETTIINPRSKCTFKPIKLPFAFPIPVGEVKDEPVEIKTEIVEIKDECQVQEPLLTALLDEIKEEIKDEPVSPPSTPVQMETDFLVPINGVNDELVEIKTEPLVAEIKDEPQVQEPLLNGLLIEIKEEIKDEPVSPTGTPTPMDLRMPVVEVKDEPMEIKTEDEIKEEIQDQELVLKALLEEIKEEIKDEPMSPTTSQVVADEKPKRVLNPAALAAAAKNRSKLHPLSRKEQIMMNKLMESKQPFLQNVPCLKLASRISKCRECRCASLRSDSVFCRFYDFRRLRFKENAILVVDGFSDPNKDPGPNDIAIWMPGPLPRDIDLDVCRFILMHVGDQFCRIWQEEQTAVKEHMSPNTTIAWKKVVKGVREICDVCETTLFNFHWTCSKCGFGVCIDCYKDRKRKRTRKIEKPTRGIDKYGWLVCTFREVHEQNTLMLTQIIPGNSLNFLAHRLHEVCKLWKIPQKCGCDLSASMQEGFFMPKFVEITNKIIKDAYLRFYCRESEIKYREKIKGLDPNNMYHSMTIMEAETALIEEARSVGTLPIVLATTLKHLKRRATVEAFSPADNIDHLQDVVTKEYNALKTQTRTQRQLSQKVMTSRSSEHMFPGIEHDWLCNGKLLRLLDSKNYRNALMFQEVWKRGQPVMVSELCKFLNISLWHPEAFCRDFGEKKNDLINCMTGNLVPNQPMKYFWEGFQCVSKRLLDSDGEPMLLKLKDWPPGDDFAEILPTRFADLMSALPLPEYTLRTGSLNIASRLPNIFVPPDLGPKMYNAYGSALHPDKGTTNLHLDISDAVNIMVYVGIPTDASAKAQIKAAMRAIDGGGCDIITRRRVRQPGVLPGALWHIYSARDADKIRDLLNRVTIERGYRLEPDHDPIHDQNWYLDNELRERLYDDYGVEGYPIVQCLGDAVFIPAGAPHQVRNLHNCIKVAEDFVSPENIQHCFHLSQQFRKLSMSHTNHEDKLQIRNVIYHAVKDTTSYLAYLLNRHL